MRLVTSSLLAGLIAFSSVAPAFADQRGRGNGRGHDRHDDRRDRDRRDWNDRDYRDGYRDGRRDDRRWDNNNRRYNGYWENNYRRDWRKGDNFWNHRHRSSHYVVVNDYHSYRLPPPRYGQRYYRDSDTGEILLIAAATGLVLWALTR